MAKWGRNPSGGSPAYLPADDVRLIGSPVWEMGDVDPNASAAGIPANAPMTVRRRGDFPTDPPAGGVEQPAAPAATNGTAGQQLSPDIMAGLSEEDAAAVTAGLEGWMSNFNPDVQRNILNELPDYGKNKPTVTEWTPDQWRAAGYTLQPAGSWDILTTPEPTAAAVVPEPPAPSVVPEPPAAADGDASLTAAEIAALAAQGNQGDLSLTSLGPNSGVTIPETGGEINVLPGTNMPIGWDIPEMGPAQFGVSSSLANRSDPWGVYSAMRAAGTPYDPRVATMGDYQQTLRRGYEPTYGRYMLAPQVSGTGTFAEFLADPTRTATGQEGLQHNFTNIANQLSGRASQGMDPRYTQFFDPNRVGADALQSNLINAALASAGGPSAWNRGLRQSLANRYQTMAMADPTQSGLGAARQFADWVSGQYGNPMAGQAMAAPTPPPVTQNQSAFVPAIMTNGGANMLNNGFNASRQKEFDWS